VKSHGEVCDDGPVSLQRTSAFCEPDDTCCPRVWVCTDCEHYTCQSR
jgi:hypothetical protein